MQSHGHDVSPFLVRAEHDEVHELLDLLVVERAAFVVAPCGHRDLPGRLRATSFDGQPDEVLYRRELDGVVLEVVVLKCGLVQGQARKILSRGVGAAEAGLAVAIETEVRVEVAAALDRLLELLLRGDLVAPALGARVRAHDEEGEEVATDEREDREQHAGADQDLAVEVRADLERVRRGGDRRDVVRGRLLDGLAGGVMLLDELGPRLLLRLQRLLVEDQVSEECKEAEEHEDADRGEDEVQVELHYSVISRTLGSQTLAWRSITFSGFVSTINVPPESLRWKSCNGFGAGPPFTTAVCLS